MSESFARALRSFGGDQFAARHGGRKESRHNGSHEYLFTCPKCGSSRLRWNSVKGGWICWACKEVGGTLELIVLFERCTYEQAVAIVENAYVGGDAPTRLAPLVVPGPRTLQVHRLPARTLPPSVPVWEHAYAMAYVRSRGIDEATARRYGLLVGVDGPTTGYVIFPCRMEGTTVYWQGRATWDPPHPPMGGDAGRAWVKAWIKQTNYRKTLNPPSKDGRASGSEALFGYDFARTQPHVVLVEGPVDAIKVGPHAIALLGQGTDAKLARLRGVPAQRYTIYLDRGESEMQRARWLARELAAFAPTYIATPPEGYDAGKLTPEQNAQVIAEAEKYRHALDGLSVR